MQAGRIAGDIDFLIKRSEGLQIRAYIGPQSFTTISIRMKIRAFFILVFTSLMWSQVIAQKIKVQYPTAHYSESLDGRLILLISDNNDTELRFQLNDRPTTCGGKMI